MDTTPDEAVGAIISSAREAVDDLARSYEALIATTKADLTAQRDAIQKAFDDYRAAHPDTLPPDPEPEPEPPAPSYGGTTGWGAARPISLARELPGTTYTTGVRLNTDQSVNSKSQAFWGQGPKGVGLLVRADRKVDATGKVTFPSADVMMRGGPFVLTVPFAIEYDLTILGSEQAGSGPAFWWRSLTGDLEVDDVEVFGAYLANGGTRKPYASKFTLIKTGSDPYNQGAESLPIPRLNGTYDGPVRYRTEITADGFARWRNGEFLGRITPAMFDAKAGAGTYAARCGAGTRLYGRLTYQIGDGKTAKVWGNPANNQGGSILLDNVRAYERLTAK